eukprot:TRINITY_DN21254_c0_g1_i1.p1 TRINITY_DN21254_c0_g1~~TRINITY_DN21254_c0_g1_i1.p1  ORF type:complete len:244 (-),score=37.24 TRINITY_DN21254_c0_g1_i1:64-795(-)
MSSGPPSSASLVKYDSPMLLFEARKRGLLPPSSKDLPPVADKSGNQSPENVLNWILPPREWVDEHNQHWIQHVSSAPATRLDAINLQERLDALFLQKGAREFGICPIRETLYDSAFDELIRQVTVSCAHRGVLLVRIRDELRMTLAAYKALYESAVAYGIRKALAGEHGRHEMEQKLTTLRRERDELERHAADLQSRCDTIERRERERREQAEKKHEEEVAFLRKANAQLTAQLQATLGATKK